MINITKEAADKIKVALANNPDLLARITIRKGGCAGTILALDLGKKEESDCIVESSGIPFSVSKETIPFLDDISIYIQNSLGSEIIIKNNSAKKTCKCGKSFCTEKLL